MRAAKWGTRDSGMTQTHRGVFGCRFQRTHSECAHLRKRPAVSALSATLQVRSCSSVWRRLWGRISERRTLNDDRNSCWITNYEELAPRFILRAAVTTASTHRYAPSSGHISNVPFFVTPRETCHPNYWLMSYSCLSFTRGKWRTFVSNCSKWWKTCVVFRDVG